MKPKSLQASPQILDPRALEVLQVLDIVHVAEKVDVAPPHDHLSDHRIVIQHWLILG
jgi:hypothetical protein